MAEELVALGKSFAETQGFNGLDVVRFLDLFLAQPFSRIGGVKNHGFIIVVLTAQCLDLLHYVAVSFANREVINADVAQAILGADENGIGGAGSIGTFADAIGSGNIHSHFCVRSLLLMLSIRVIGHLLFYKAWCLGDFGERAFLDNLRQSWRFHGKILELPQAQGFLGLERPVVFGDVSLDGSQIILVPAKRTGE